RGTRLRNHSNSVIPAVRYVNIPNCIERQTPRRTEAVTCCRAISVECQTGKELRIEPCDGGHITRRVHFADEVVTRISDVHVVRRIYQHRFGVTYTMLRCSTVAVEQADPSSSDHDPLS